MHVTSTCQRGPLTLGCAFIKGAFLCGVNWQMAILMSVLFARIVCLAGAKQEGQFSRTFVADSVEISFRNSTGRKMSETAKY